MSVENITHEFSNEYRIAELNYDFWIERFFDKQWRQFNEKGYGGNARMHYGSLEEAKKKLLVIIDIEKKVEKETVVKYHYL